MMAYIVEWGWFKLGTYGLMMAMGFLCGWALMRSEFRRRGIDPLLASRITFNAAIWGVIGARVLSMLEDPGRVLDSPVRTLLLEGGLTWYGGLTGGVVASLYTMIRAKAPILDVFDAMSPAALVGYACGRVGCLLSGDGCYGQATDLPWGMSFPNAPREGGFHCLRQGAIATWPPVDPASGRRYPADVLVHPTPLYEVLGAMALFGLLWMIRRRVRRPGVMFGIFFICLAIPRFFVEYIRLNPRYAGFSLSQWISFGMLGFGLGLIIRGMRSLEPRAVAAEAGGSTTERSGRGRRKRR